MGRHLTGALAALALGVGAGAALGGCGSGSTRTVSVAGAPTTSASTPSTSTPDTATATNTGASTATSTTSTTATSSAPASEAGGTAAPTTGTRSAPEPAFTHTESDSEALTQALAVLQAHGYAADETAVYHAGQTLRVLIGSHASRQQAFFFVGERYIGTDTKEPSASIEVLSQGDTEVTLGYALYRGAVATGEQATVRFQLDDGKLAALDPIPPASSANGPGRL